MKSYQTREGLLHDHAGKHSLVSHANSTDRDSLIRRAARSSCFLSMPACRHTSKPARRALRELV